MAVKFLYVTAGSVDEARRIGAALVEERLAACANILEGMRSLYWWEGRVQDDQEAVLILKTSDRQVKAAIERVKALHSYDVPCVVALPVEVGNPAFLDWVEQETAG
ncbi:MAG: divalent-cation tolerance protein CutA [Alphaproteobacteria bacterium]|nr:divalent-cation tolerance protein CutA [Alphaproteobacteria bacterium]